MKLSHHNSVTYLFINSTHLLSVYHVLGIVLGTRYSEVNKTDMVIEKIFFMGEERKIFKWIRSGLSRKYPPMYYDK